MKLYTMLDIFIAFPALLKIWIVFTAGCLVLCIIHWPAAVGIYGGGLTAAAIIAGIKYAVDHFEE